MIKNVYQTDKEIEQSLFNSLYEWMMTTPIDKISVNQIVDRAYVSRASFYRRYQDKYDLLNQAYERILEQTLFTFNQGNTWRDSIYQIYAVIGDNWKFFRNAFHSTDCNSLKHYIFDRTLRLESEILRRNGVDPDDPANTYRLIAYVSGGLELTVRWVDDHAQFPLPKLVEIFIENVPDGFKDFFV